MMVVVVDVVVVKKCEVVLKVGVFVLDEIDVAVVFVVGMIVAVVDVVVVRGVVITN